MNYELELPLLRELYPTFTSAEIFYALHQNQKYDPFEHQILWQALKGAIFTGARDIGGIQEH